MRWTFAGHHRHRRQESVGPGPGQVQGVGEQVQGVANLTNGLVWAGGGAVDSRSVGRWEVTCHLSLEAIPRYSIDRVILEGVGPPQLSHSGPYFDVR